MLTEFAGEFMTNTRTAAGELPEPIIELRQVVDLIEEGHDD